MHNLSVPIGPKHLPSNAVVIESTDGGSRRPGCVRLSYFSHMQNKIEIILH